MENPDLTKPSHSPVYDPVAATAFFKAAGKIESAEPGAVFFTERQQRGFFSGDDRMFLLLEGRVGISVGSRPIDTVKRGEIFGEMATITRSPRSATATAKSACSVIALDGRQFQKAIEKNPGFALMLMSIMIDRLRLTLARLVMTKALPDKLANAERRVFDEKTLDEIKKALGKSEPAYYSTGQTIFTAGEAGELMYLPRRGTVVITVDGKTVETVGPGGVFGEMALVDSAPRAASAVAETTCSLMTVNRKQFLDLLQTKPAFGLSLLKLLGQRLQAVTMIMSE
jgi:CRP-like cAMP-binding protein